MEPASFAVGLVGLAGLFSSCLEAVERAQSYRSFASDSKGLDIQFGAAKVRLENWGRAVGFNDGRLGDEHHPALDDEKTRGATVEIFRLVSDICEPPDARQSRSLLATLGGTSADAGSDQPLTLREQVELLKDLVLTLHNLVPPDAVHGTRGLHAVETRSSTLGPERGSSPPNAWSTEFHQLISRLEAKSRRELHAWLRHVPDERYEYSLQERLQVTCHWILKQPIFLNWISPEFPAGAKVLWIHGPAGFGKSVLCATIVEDITKALPTPVARFFFSSDSDSREDPFLAVRSWISQVVTQHDGAFHHVLQRQEADADPYATRHTVVSLFKSLVRMVPDCTFVVDGIDECTHLDGTTNSVTNFLQTVVAATAGTDSRVLVVSRSLSTIRHALESDVGSTFSEYQIRSDDVQPDIVAYSRDLVDTKLHKKHNDVRSSLSGAMAERCNGQFLWLKLQGKSLRAGMNEKRLRNVIKETPAELDHIYDNSWKTITRLREADKYRVFALLRWTAFALRPLTTSEITAAVLIDDAGDLLWDDLPDHVDTDYVDSEVVSLCSPFLEVQKGPANPMSSQQTVHLPHFTVRQYLLYKLPVPDWVRQNNTLHISHAQLHHTLLAKACLQYIKHRRVWQETPLGSEAPHGASFRSYAATSWHRHVGLGHRSNAEITSLAIEFFSKNSPTWEAWRMFIDLEDAKQHGEQTETSPPGPLHYSVKLPTDGSGDCID
ncbi:hypothetical protein ACHAQH_007925 [Verticillium albo-atrum]